MTCHRLLAGLRAPRIMYYGNWGIRNNCGHIWGIFYKIDSITVAPLFSPILLRANTSTRDLEQTVRAIIPTDFHGHAAVTPDCITFFTKEQSV